MNSPAAKDLKARRVLNKLAMTHAWEALFCAPKKHIDCTNVQSVCYESLQPHAYELSFTGNIETLDKRGTKHTGFEWWMNPSRVDMEFTDDHGNPVRLALFGGFGAWVAMQPNTRIAVAASIRRFGANLYLQNAMLIPSNYLGRIWPQYTGVPRAISKSTMEELIAEAHQVPLAAESCAAKIIEVVADLSEGEILDYANGDNPFSSLSELITSLHNPESLEIGQAALAAAARISALSIKGAAIRSCRRVPSKFAPILTDPDDVKAICSSLPEVLSDEQTACIHGISKAVQSETPMIGLLSGDVGTGKTLTFLIPVVAAHRAGAQCAIIAPTQILADQIADQLTSRFSKLGIQVERVPSGGRILNPKAILVGTHGLSSVARKAKYVPNLLIADEQHKMGVIAREAMLGPLTHMLEVSATPMPRTLATAIYGGFQVFTLKNSPVKKTIQSHVIDLTERPSATAQIRRSIAQGQKVAIIYPIVAGDDPQSEAEDEDDDETSRPATRAKPGDVQSVLSAAATLEQHFPGQVAVLHGGMSDDAKRTVLEQIRLNQKPLVVASTIMESGIDIPSITTMIVRDADRFGAAQLHQLRGRLVRNGGTGQFIMMVKSIPDLAESALQRLEMVASTNDGFRLSEHDMIQRGFGSILGHNQSGATQSIFRLLKLSASDFMRIEAGAANRHLAPKNPGG